jgi:electron transfer flavoprotein beta subunit
MHFVVLVKQVPKTMNISLKKDFTVDRDVMEKIMNPADQSALHMALELKKTLRRNGYVHYNGTGKSRGMSREAAMQGADALYHLCDAAFAGSDSLATAKVLSAAVRFCKGADLILCGRHSVDGETGQVGPEISVFLEVSCVTNVLSVLEITDSSLVCSRLTENETQIVRTKLPALLSVCEFHVTSDLPSIAAVRNATRMPVVRLTAKELNLPPGTYGKAGSPTLVKRVYLMERKKRNARFLSFQESINALADLLKGG